MDPDPVGTQQVDERRPDSRHQRIARRERNDRPLLAVDQVRQLRSQWTGPRDPLLCRLRGQKVEMAAPAQHHARVQDDLSQVLGKARPPVGTDAHDGDTRWPDDAVRVSHEPQRYRRDLSPVLAEALAPVQIERLTGSDRGVGEVPAHGVSL